MLRGVASTSGAATGPRREAAAAASLVTLVLLAGCAAAADDTQESLADLVVERDRVSAELHADDLERAASYLRDRWGPVTLPQESIERWVQNREWGGVMSRCLAEEGLPGAQAADGGERIDFSGVTAVGPRELYLADVAVYSCQARFPVRAWYADQVASLAAPWAWEYSARILVPCLLAAGHRPPALPAESQFLESWGSGEFWNPYADLGVDPLLAQRARSECPPPEVVLESAP